MITALMLSTCAAMSAQGFDEQADTAQVCTPDTAQTPVPQTLNEYLPDTAQVEVADTGQVVIETPPQPEEPFSVYNLSEFRRLADGEKGKYVMHADTVYFVIGNDVFLRSDGSILLRNTGLPFESRQIVTGTLYGQKQTIDGMTVLVATENDPHNSMEVREYADPQCFESALSISHCDDSELAKRLLDYYLNNLVSLDNVEVIDETTGTDGSRCYQARLTSMGNQLMTLTDPYGYCANTSLVGKVFNGVTGYLTHHAGDAYQLCLLNDVANSSANGIFSMPAQSMMQNEAGVVYDLQGRRVAIANPKLKNGLYIQNGKKVMRALR